MKTISKIIVAAAIALMPAVSFAQAAFDKFADDSNFTTVSVNKKAFSMLAQIDTKSTGKEAQEARKMVSKVESFKVITTEKPASIPSLKSTTESYIKSSGLEELMIVKDKGTDVKIMVKSGATATQVTEILLFVLDSGKEPNAVTLIVKGLFDLDELNDLTEKVLPKATDANIDSKLDQVKDALVLKVSPNPAKDVFYINTDDVAEVKLYDASGRLVKTQQYSGEGVSTAGIAPGNYVVEINTEGKRQTQHIVIK